MSAAATLSNFHLYSPGYGSNPTQMFTNAFLNTLKPFSTIRFVNWNDTINSTISNWQQVTPPDSFLATAGSDSGVPYQDIIELANESQKNMWINIPALATPNFVQNLAELIDSELDPNLDVYVEYSDETWSAAWKEYQQVYQASLSNPLVTAPEQTGRNEQESAYQIASASEIFHQVFGEAARASGPSSRAFPTIQTWRKCSSSSSRKTSETRASTSGASRSHLTSDCRKETMFPGFP